MHPEERQARDKRHGAIFGLVLLAAWFSGFGYTVRWATGPSIPERTECVALSNSLSEFDTLQRQYNRLVVDPEQTEVVARIVTDASRLSRAISRQAKGCRREN